MAKPELTSSQKDVLIGLIVLLVGLLLLFGGLTQALGLVRTGIVGLIFIGAFLTVTGLRIIWVS